VCPPCASAKGEGFSAAITPPERFVEGPSTLAGSKGHVSELGSMLDEY
jgi:hypothetical protein